jgi:hypothetical protein
LITARGNAQLAGEGAGYVTLVREAGFKCCLDGGLAICQKLPRMAYASLDQVGMRRYSHFACETSQELESADARLCSQFGQRHWRVRSRV